MLPVITGTSEVEGLDNQPQSVGGKLEKGGEDARTGEVAKEKFKSLKLYQDKRQEAKVKSRRGRESGGEKCLR